jgi:hypothetical protein
VQVNLKVMQDAVTALSSLSWQPRVLSNTQETYVQTFLNPTEGKRRRELLRRSTLPRLHLTGRIRLGNTECHGSWAGVFARRRKRIMGVNDSSFEAFSQTLPRNWLSIIAARS